MRWLLPLLLALYTCTPQPMLAACLHDCVVDQQGYEFVERFEGYRPFVYADIVGIKTVGFGHVLQPGEQIRTPLMGPDALTLLESDVTKRVGVINRMISRPLESYQFDALASFTYNVGTGRFQSSSVLKRVNARLDGQVAGRLLLYDVAGGQHVDGLHRRRAGEGTMFNGGNP